MRGVKAVTDEAPAGRPRASCHTGADDVEAPARSNCREQGSVRVVMDAVRNCLPGQTTSALFEVRSEVPADHVTRIRKLS